MKQLVTSLGLALLAVGSQAAPVAVTLPTSFTLTPYSGTVAVNAGLLDSDRTLFTVREQAHDGLQSWYLVYDPLNPGRVRATLDFGAPIVAVYATTAELAASQADWSVDIDGDGVFNDYAFRNLMGLESVDITTWTVGGSLLSIDWRADDPGDHLRVLVRLPQENNVPEPASAALVLLGLGLGAASARRRRR